MAYQKIEVPAKGQEIEKDGNGNLEVPNKPVIPFIEGDGIGSDITPVMMRVVDEAVRKAYGNGPKIHWMEVYAGEKANHVYGENTWLPQETLDAIRDYKVAIKGPLTTPVGGGIRSLNVALRQKLDLYVCLRPVRYFKGTPSPLKHPENTNMVIFRENSEDIYAGVEWEAGTTQAERVMKFLCDEMGVDQIRFTDNCGIGVKPVSKQGSQRLVRRAIQYAVDHDCPSVTLVHKGNIMKYTEGSFKAWGYELARDEFGAEPYEGGPWHIMTNPNTGNDIIIKDVIADAFLQQILLRPQDYSVIATLNLNGDYISDALAAQVGGIGIAPGANIGDESALFEATHGTAPKHAGQNKANPSSIILSSEMLLRHLQWNEAADKIVSGMEGAIQAGTVTYDFAREMDNATKLSTSEFGEALIKHM